MEQNKYYYQCKDYYRQYRQKKLPQLAGMYVARLVYLNILPQVKQKLSKETRRELKKLNQYTNDIELLAKNKIEDITQLDSYQENKQDELDYLIKQRQQCYYYRRNSKDEDEKEVTMNDAVSSVENNNRRGPRNKAGRPAQRREAKPTQE